MNTAGAVALSTDAGATWTQTGAPPDTVFGLEAHPEDATRAYATAASGVYQTTDAGATWTRQLNRRGMHAIKAFPGQPGTVVAAGESGVCISYDGGENWEDMNEGLPERPVHCLEFALVAPFGELRLFAGTVGSAAYTWSFNVGVEEPRAGGTLPRTRAATVAANAYRHPGTGPATLYDRLGREAAMLQPGENDISGLKAGVYFVRTESGQTDTKLLVAR